MHGCVSGGVGGWGSRQMERVSECVGVGVGGVWVSKQASE